MVIQSPIYPECVETLAQRFDLKARSVYGVVQGRENAALSDSCGAEVFFRFSSEIGDMMRVAKGRERADYMMRGRSDFEVFNPNLLFGML